MDDILEHFAESEEIYSGGVLSFRHLDVPDAGQNVAGESEELLKVLSEALLGDVVQAHVFVFSFSFF